jgi:carboxyl-terminal processing protease
LDYSGDRPNKGLGIFLVLAILVVTLLGGWLGEKVSAGAPLEEDTQRLLKAFTATLDRIHSDYAREVDGNRLIESGIRGLLRTLDPHSSFFSRTDYSKLQEEQKGKYYGLGISIKAESPGSGRVVVERPPSVGTPAYKAGIQVGDVISKIRGKSIEDWDLLEEVIPNLKGPKGTTVQITIERPGVPEPIEMTVERDEIPMYTIEFAFYLPNEIGYVKIKKFSETTGEELNDALIRLDESKLRALILDLRDNPGGALNQAIQVADRFLSKGQLVVRTRMRKGRGHEYVAPKGRVHGYPMVVLIDRNSASASEIVAGALQDHDRALIVGETSFGKALVQTIYPLEQNRGLALTTGRYYTPSDRLIQRSYRESFYEYFSGRRDNSSSERTEHKTDSGRPVFGGGGITPDEEVSQPTRPKILRQLALKGSFRQFVEKLSKGDLDPKFRFPSLLERWNNISEAEKGRLRRQHRVAEKILGRFRQYLDDKKIVYDHAEFDENKRLIKTYLERQLMTRVMGEEEGQRVALSIDEQLRKAIELLPRAKALFDNVVAVKQGDT